MGLSIIRKNCVAQRGSCRVMYSDTEERENEVCARACTHYEQRVEIKSWGKVVCVYA